MPYSFKLSWQTLSWFCSKIQYFVIKLSWTCELVIRPCLMWLNIREKIFVISFIVTKIMKVFYHESLELYGMYVSLVVIVMLTLLGNCWWIWTAGNSLGCISDWHGLAHNILQGSISGEEGPGWAHYGQYPPLMKYYPL